MENLFILRKNRNRGANAVDPGRFSSRQGEKPLRSGREKRLASDPQYYSEGNRWYDPATEREGGMCHFDFVRISFT